jgi:hypothetical protein
VSKISAHLLERLLAVALLFGANVALARPAAEEPDNLLNDRVTLQAGLIASSNQTELRRDSTAGTTGTELDAERDLGLPVHKLTGRGELMIRMHERHRVRLGNYFLPLDRRAATALTKAINFGDTTFNVGETVGSALRVRLFSLNYTYSFIKNDRAEFGASLGLNVIGFDAQATVPSRLRTERDERSGPAPLLGLDGAVRISGRFYAEARGQYLKVQASNVQGKMTTLDANILYRLTPNITVGSGYDSYYVSVDALKTGDSGRFSLRSRGPQAFVRVGF